MKTRLIRLDDYPNGNPKFWNKNTYKETVRTMLSIFERYKIDYILGVSPLLLTDDDIIFLNDNVINGNVVMHGFDHGFNTLDWTDVTKYWKDGGEFYNLDEEKIENLYLESDKILKRIKKYDNKHFIPPFNTFTQKLLNVLNKHGVEYIHTCDVEYNNYNQHMYNYGNIKQIISKFKKTYDYADSVINNLHDTSQITLHWIFDSSKPNWTKDYETLCKALTSNVISFSMWGKDKKYLIGAVKNIELAKKYYPDWKCRFYINNTIDIDFARTLFDMGSDIYLIKDDSEYGGLFWRFFVNDDNTVGRYIIRDTDCRITEREAFAVNEWVDSNIPFHCIKDHPWQSGVPILGGLWGSVRGCIPDMTSKIREWVKTHGTIKKGYDQYFLRDVIWPIVKDIRIEHDEISHPNYRNINTVKFPSKREGYRFVGEIYDENDNVGPEWEALKKLLDNGIYT